MKINVEFNSVGEMKEFANLMGGGATSSCKCKSVKNVTKEEVKNEEEVKVEDPKKEVNELEPEVVEETNTEEIKVTKEQVRAAFIKARKAGKQTESREITKKYGASKLSELKEEDYSAVLSEVEALLN